jgi:mono/diheme cytochrome c family protein
LTDCASCHSSDRPSDHESGQCSQCHSTNNWDADGDEDVEDDDERDEDDSEDDEHGSLNVSPPEGSVALQPPLECGTCHPDGKLIDKSGFSTPQPSWWLNLWTMLKKMVSVSLG